MVSWILIATLGVAVVAIGFFVVTIFSLQDMLEAQRNTEDRLRTSEESLRAVIDNTKTLISVKQPDGRYAMINRSFEKAFGVSALMARGRRDDELFTPVLAAALRAHDDRVLHGNESVELDQTLELAGESRRYYCVKTPLHGAGGEVVGVCLVATDVTERELARQERNRIFELSLDMMTVGSFEGSLTVVNPQFERVSGFTAAELASMPGLDLAHPDDRVDCAKALHALRSGYPVVDFRFRLRCKDGSYKLCQFRSMPAVEEGMIYSVGREVVDAELEAEADILPETADPPRTRLTVAKR